MLAPLRMESGEGRHSYILRLSTVAELIKANYDDEKHPDSAVRNTFYP